MANLDISKKIKKDYAEEEAIKKKLSNLEENPTPEVGNSDKLFYIAIGVIALIIIGIIFIPKLMPKPNEIIESYTYNYFEFEKIHGTWFTNSQEGDLLFQVNLRFGPKEVETIPVSGNIREFTKYHKIFISINSEDKGQGYIAMANAEVSTKLAQHYGVTPLVACTKNSTICYTFNATIANCETKNDFPENGIIEFINDPTAITGSVEVDGNCVTLKGNNETLIQAADRFMLGYYGIME